MTDGRTTHDRPLAAALTEAAGAARMAPSVHNTQPWRWQVSGDGLDLYAERSRQLRVADPDGRMLLLSCGAALHHVRLALAAEGWNTEVTRFPSATDGDHLARVVVTGPTPVTPEAMRLFQSAEIRHTDRRAVSDAPVPAEALDALRAVASAEGAQLHVLPAEQVAELASASARADTIGLADPAQRAETAAWVGGGRDDGRGVPDAAVPDRPAHTGVPLRDFGHAGTLDPGAGHDRAARYAVLYSAGDEPVEWLRAGEALSAVWLNAVERGLTVLPFSAVVEVGATRERLRGMLGNLGVPHLVLRFGSADPDRPGPGHTGRLPVGEVVSASPLTDAEVAGLDAYWRATNYLTVGQIYLLDNPLLREPLTPEHIKPRLLGHWGTSPGLNLLYAHVNRAIMARDLNAILVTGPGHGGPAIVANTWLEGTYSELYPAVGRDEAGMARLFRQFSFPGGIPSHVAPEVPGSIHEGGELGYSLMHAFGAAFDNPDLVVVCVVGDGEAETGPLAASWLSNVFLNPARDGAVLPVLHLNGYKIANPAVLDRIGVADLEDLMRGFGYEPIFVVEDDPQRVHRSLAAALDRALGRIATIQRQARGGGEVTRPRWPMLVLRTPKGWTGPRTVDGEQVEGTFRAHQVPLSGVRDNPAHLAELERWLRSYRPEELFDATGAPVDELARLAPRGIRRMSANPHANGGTVLRDLVLPDFRDYAVVVDRPGAPAAEATRVLGEWLRDVVRANPDRFRLFGPDEVTSNRLGAVLDVTDRTFVAQRHPGDDHLAPDGRVMEVLSEHLCQGWLEGYLLTGRHGLFTSYEAFIHVVDSMVNQHAKWLKVTRHIPWRRPIASLNYLLSSHVWRQDHNGFSHQDPGFIDHVVNKKAEIVRVYLPPDANTLLSTMDHCLRSRHYINVVVAGKQPAPSWLSMDEAVLHCQRGLGIWDWAGSDGGSAPDVVLACAGDVPTLETLAAADLLRRHLPELRVRVVNVVNLMRLQPPGEHPHGLPDTQFDTIFTRDRPIIFAYHGYPWLIHRLTYRRTNHGNLHVRGYKEEGTTTTPFDMVMLNDLDRFHLVMDVIDRVPGLGATAAGLRQAMEDARQRCRDHTRVYGEDPPEIRDWTWPART